MLSPTVLAEPIVLAPMAGGPATVDLAVAVSGAGGLGFLAGAGIPPQRLRDDLADAWDRMTAPFGANLFVPGSGPADGAAVAAYAERLRERGLELGEPRWDDDGWDAKVGSLLERPPAVVSFTFGLPPRDLVDALHARDVAVWITVTTPGEALAARDAGADALICQGVEAGGHRGGIDPSVPGDLGVLALLQLVTAAVDLPVIAAGGIATGAGVAGVLAAGAVAAQVGTAFMRSPEAGTTPVHREALAGDAPTALTRAFSGRSARGIINEFMREHDAAAPLAYPEVHHLTTPLRAAARAAGDAEGFNLWAGQAHALAREEPAGDIVRRLGAEARRRLPAR